MKASAPAWSLKGRETYKHTEVTPGPGAYSPSSYLAEGGPNYGLGKSPRPELVAVTKQSIPGPGAYSPRAVSPSARRPM